MTDQWSDDWYGAKSGPGERWNVNLPALIGVVFVFLLGVIVWVIVDARTTDGDGGDSARPGLTGSTLAEPSDSTPDSIATTTLVTTLVTPATTLDLTVDTGTSPIPLPVTSPDPAPTGPPPATAPPAPAPTAPPPTEPDPTVVTVPVPTAPPENGDLRVPGHALQRPPCDGGYITILGSSVGDEATPEGMDAFLDRYPGSNYLRTDLTCASLTQSKNGQPIYVVFLGPFLLDGDACSARSKGPSGTYVKRLSTDLPPDHSVKCS